MTMEIIYIEAHSVIFFKYIWFITMSISSIPAVSNILKKKITTKKDWKAIARLINKKKHIKREERKISGARYEDLGIKE